MNANISHAAQVKFGADYLVHVLPLHMHTARQHMLQGACLFHPDQLEVVFNDRVSAGTEPQAVSISGRSAPKLKSRR